MSKIRSPPVEVGLAYHVAVHYIVSVFACFSGRAMLLINSFLAILAAMGVHCVRKITVIQYKPANKKK
jgi:hypothetical protein